MSLNPNFSAVDALSPCAKLSFNINAFNALNAFNGYTSNFNHACSSPKLAVPVQPHQEVPWMPTSTNLTPGMMRPM